jgi:hypothetical protein
MSITAVGGGYVTCHLNQRVVTGGFRTNLVRRMNISKGFDCNAKYHARAGAAVRND